MLYNVYLSRHSKNHWICWVRQLLLMVFTNPHWEKGICIPRAAIGYIVCFSKETTSERVGKKSYWQSGGKQGQVGTCWEPLHLSITASDYDLQRIMAAAPLPVSVFVQVLLLANSNSESQSKGNTGKHSSQLNHDDPSRSGILGFIWLFFTL